MIPSPITRAGFSDHAELQAVLRKLIDSGAIKPGPPAKPVKAYVRRGIGVPASEGANYMREYRKARKENLET